MASHLVLHVNGEAKTLCGLPFTPYMELAKEGDPSCPNCQHLDEVGSVGLSLSQTAPPPKPRASVTCYIPAFTELNGRKRRTVCGRWIGLNEHSTTPTCPTCAAWLASAPAREAEDDDTAAALEAEFPEYKNRLTAK